jgi:carbamoyltransferase
MRVLGLAMGEADATAALTVDGSLVAAAAEERFTRQRHDPSWPVRAVAWCLEHAGIAAGDLDRVVLAEDPYARFSRELASSLGEGLRPAQFARTVKGWLGSRLWGEDTVATRLGVAGERVSVAPRRRCLAAGAFAGSGWDDAAILVLDGAAEWEGTTLARARWHGDVLDLEELEHLPYPHALGLVTDAFTELLALDEPDALFDLAAWGRPLWEGRVRKALRPGPDGTFSVNADCYRAGDERPFRPALTDLVGAPRDARRPLPFGTGAPIDAEDQRFADLAASVQAVLEEVVLGLARRLHARAGGSGLCLAGGLARNPTLVARIRREGPFAHVFVPVDPSPAVGAAHLRAAHRPRGPAGPFLGRSYDPAPDLAAIALADPTFWQRFRRRGTRSTRGARVVVERGVDTATRLPELLAGGVAVGWCTGRFGVGPRALGHRVALVPAARSASFAELSLGRAPWRRRTLLAEAGGWATDAVPGSITGATHADGTVRPLGVAAGDPLRAALAAGPVVALGLAEEPHPLAASPADALLIFMRTDLDVLFLDDAMVRKEYP